jgi:catechol 2,3-dioxygenase-like lactoylglutathione lyase family enzyme
MHVNRLDHVVLTVRDIDTTARFYTRVLGMKAVTFGGGRTALVFGQQKLNLHLHGAEFEPKAARPTPGSADLCFTTDASPEEVLAHLETCGVVVLEGPVQRIGALGPMTSIYFRDPDENLIEVSNYGPGGRTL